MAELCKASGLSTTSELDNARLRVGIEQVHQLLLYAIKKSGDVDIGLHMGESSRPSALDIVGHLLLSSPDMTTAFKQVRQYHNLFGERIRFHAYRSKQNVVIEIEFLGEWQQVYGKSIRHVIDYTLVTFVRILGMLSEKKVLPARVHFAYPKPPDLKEYERIFGTKPFFDQTANQLYFSETDMEVSIKGYNSQLFRILEEHAQQLLEQLEGNAGIANSVKKELIRNMDAGFLSMEEVAAKLNKTARWLQRKLSDEGTSFRQLSNDLKRKFAERYLEEEKITIAEIAYRLGYAEPNAFSRAFKKWTGLSPAEYRAKSG